MIITCAGLMLSGCTAMKATPVPSVAVAQTVAAGDLCVSDPFADVFSEPDTKSERLTQVLCNDQLRKTGESTGWYQVETLSGVRGYIRARSVVESSKRSLSGLAWIMVTARNKKVMISPKGTAAWQEVVMGTSFMVVRERDGWYEVILPDGKSGYLDYPGTIRIENQLQVPMTSPDDFVATVEKFLDVVYTIGGRSYQGVDSQGLVQVCGRVNGLNVPADLKQQMSVGIHVEREKLQPGDLIFFSDAPGGKNVDDVGVFLSGDQFIHASRTRNKVMKDKLSDGYYQTRFMEARRLYSAGAGGGK